jgi:hypothetical protein
MKETLDALVVYDSAATAIAGTGMSGEVMQQFCPGFSGASRSSVSARSWPGEGGPDCGTVDAPRDAM